MSDNHLGKAHRYFSLSDYEIDPHSRYRKRIFHEHTPSWSTQARPDRAPDISASRPEVLHTKQNVQAEARRKRRRDDSPNGYATDDSYDEAPPLSPFSPTASIFEGVEDVSDGPNSPDVSDRETPPRSISTRLDLKGKGATYPARLPISARPHPPPNITAVSPRFPDAFVASSSITRYSNSRLAERARLASLPPPPTHTPVIPRGTSPPKATIDGNYRSHMKSSERELIHTAQQRGEWHHSSEVHADNSLATRVRRATVSGSASDSGRGLEVGFGRHETTDERVPGNNIRISESGRDLTPEIDKIKLENMSPPPLDLDAPEKPYAAIQAARIAEEPPSAASVAESSRRRKRSKSSASMNAEAEPSRVIEAEKGSTRKKGDRGTPNQVFKQALESGDYIQISDSGWVCKIHGDHLGGSRSVTRHHESVHLNIVVECEYCNAQFSRRDAVLRHQRQSSCKTGGKWKV